MLRLFVACALLLADSRNMREHCGERSMVMVAVLSNPVFAVGKKQQQKAQAARGLHQADNQRRSAQRKAAKDQRRAYGDETWRRDLEREGGGDGGRGRLE